MCYLIILVLAMFLFYKLLIRKSSKLTISSLFITMMLSFLLVISTFIIIVGC